MEKRAILAAVLMAALLVIYQTFFFPAGQEPAQKPPAAPTAQAPAPAAVPAPPAPAPTAAAVPRPSEAPRPPQRLVPVDAPLYRAVVSSEGGKLQEHVLKYRGEKPMVMVGDLGPAGLLLGADPLSPGEPVPMTISPERLTVRPGSRDERGQAARDEERGQGAVGPRQHCGAGHAHDRARSGLGRPRRHVHRTEGVRAPEGPGSRGIDQLRSLPTAAALGAVHPGAADG